MHAQVNHNMGLVRIGCNVFLPMLLCLFVIVLFNSFVHHYHKTEYEEMIEKYEKEKRQLRREAREHKKAEKREHRETGDGRQTSGTGFLAKIKSGLPKNISFQQGKNKPTYTSGTADPSQVQVASNAA